MLDWYWELHIGVKFLVLWLTLIALGMLFGAMVDYTSRN